ncbi:MAG: 2,3-bisphosphoglycerate-independent phosphoglycerate mutase [Candidatus Magasanikbacteria bacterium]|nr:2,3-bisphosphoglycerate-independent phosphoglycerate mutase [Candidatus Magasanikbacteria bacterium]
MNKNRKNIKPAAVVLIILDGWGARDSKAKGNPITPKNAPNYFSWLKKYPHTTLQASGEEVGLFKGQEGNSEAGHLNLGAGRVVKQDARYVTDAITDGTFFKNNAFHEAFHHVKKYRTAVHVMGLLSNHNSAHSCPEHLYALLDLFKREGLKKIYLHLFTDGRDSGQHDAPTHLKKLREHFRGNESIASLMGRLYGMDRNKNWDRTKAAYEALVLGKGLKAKSTEEAISLAYNSGDSDEFIRPTIMVDKNNKPVATIKDNDAIFFFNLRSDRARQFTKAFVQPTFEHENGGTFKRQKFPKNTRFVAMTDFGPDLPRVLTAFPSRDVVNSLPFMLDGREQLYVAESEKFAHITYFFNGGYADHGRTIRWVKVASNRVKDFNVDPAMKSAELAHYMVKAIASGQYEFMAVNFANADMLGHTGNISAAALGINALDKAIGEVVTAALKKNNVVCITADHGNAEEMINLKTGEFDSEHSVAAAPFLLIANRHQYDLIGMNKRERLRSGGRLADVAPTILKIFGIKPPKEMTGKSLF